RQPLVHARIPTLRLLTVPRRRMAAQFSMDTRTLPRRLARSRWLAAIIAVVALLAWAVFIGKQLGALQRYSWQIAPGAFVLSVIGSAGYFGGLALCWGLLLRHVNAGG